LTGALNWSLPGLLRYQKYNSEQRRSTFFRLSFTMARQVSFAGGEHHSVTAVTV
jgi:hypothetical protein